MYDNALSLSFNRYRSYDVAIYANKHRRTFILKPYSAGQGRGIWLTNNLRTVGKREKLICQTYVDKVSE